MLGGHAASSYLARMCPCAGRKHKRRHSGALLQPAFHHTVSSCRLHLPPMAYKQDNDEFGWTSVPRNRSNVPKASDVEAKSIPVGFDAIWPRTPIVARAQEHVKEQLPEKTYNHSLRVYCYGQPGVEETVPSTAADSPQDTPWSLSTSPTGFRWTETASSKRGL